MTIVVVVIDASLKSRSPAPAETLSGQAWIDQVLPIIARSSTEGREITQLRTAGLGMSASTISAELDQITQAAQANYTAVLDLKAPASAGGAPGLLEASLLVRSQAAKAATAALDAVLTGAPPASPADPKVQALATAGEDFSVSDRAYQLFATNLPASLGVSMPPSVWVADPSIWTAAGLQVFLVALRNGTSLTPVHQVTIEAVSTDPPPVATTANVQRFAPTQGFTVTIVVADTGNQPEDNLTISAAVAPAAAGQASRVRDFTSLTPGSSYATTIGPIGPASGAPSTLTVTVTPPAGSSLPVATKTLAIEVAAPPPPTTTTTTTTPPTPAG